VSAQLTAVKQNQSAAGQLSGGLQSAKNHENHIANQRAQALAAATAAAAAAAERARAKSTPSTPASYTGSSASSSQGDIAADFALSQIGKPYQWGAVGPSTYDCSGLAMVAWSQAGVSLLHYTGDQWNEGAHVSLSNMQRGDLIFYATNNSDPATIHHVGIYIGGGQMVDAPYTGVDVRIDSIYQPGQPIGAVRP
jgi:cell wall-associated NlpC family hydrolase